ncbi:aminoglycoside adenylyltransferase family protein [Citrobacter portucalensis]|uniref:aminoglycoside adenylyltransferase family protein n=1 Tax=Citrobacter portucalensis TaxID=1639133 RepID=UPI002433ED9F|nr:aminoglycoside adenylyltransferase family protein [Citrobacter portucalensis]WFZ27798.1 aminoglycoside adenylyltransferase family protein [Citrobacter portucalensis]WFZ32797.1 aminoglycoside adenylyltransferase family protein [Citrobacter portucalensis]
MSTTIPDSIRRQVNAASALIARIIEGDLVAVHLYGSAVEGGLKPQSDIDLLVTIRQPLNTRQRKDLMQGFLEISAPPGSVDSYRALEVTIVVYSQLVPWQFPPSREMQFGEWLRDDILAGIVEPTQLDPDLSILLTQARRASVALFGEPAGTLFNVIPFSDVVQTFRHILDMWQKPGDLEGDERNIILTLARIWYSVVTGNIVAKDEAASWLIPQLPDEYADTLQAARAEYLGLTKKNWAASMPSVERFVFYAKKQIADRLE